MVGNGLRGFTGTEIAVKVDFPASPLLLDPNAITDQALAHANLPMVTGEVVKKALGADAEQWVAPTAWTALRDAIQADPKILAQTVTIRPPAATALDLAAKGDGSPAAEASVAPRDKAGLLATGTNWMTGRAQSRERVCAYRLIAVDAGNIK